MGQEVELKGLSRPSARFTELAIARVCLDIRGRLENLLPLALQTFVIPIFKNFSIEKSGTGIHVNAKVVGYELREEVKLLLAQHTTLEDQYTTNEQLARAGT